MRKYLFSITMVFLSYGIFGQTYNDYIGAGHSQGITATSSSSYEGATAINTINGNGLDVPMYEASRFLGQATLGSDITEIEHVMSIGPETWLQEQYNLPATFLTTVMEEIWKTRLQIRVDMGENPDDVFGPYSVDFGYAWWQQVLTNQDQLRHRIAFALSEIFVISINSDLGDNAHTLTSYYDMLLKNSFGNYRDLLYDVSMHPSMGYYLSHLNNAKANEELNQRPDENYAREIMQLFSIGLDELNIDGSKKMQNGATIPTYDNDDIREFAKIFTGLGAGAINENVYWTDEPYFGLGIYGIDPAVPLKMYENFHETESKTLLNGFFVPAHQTGMKDINDAIDVLFYHPNVGPFIAYRLIQRLVKSNPSPGYVQRVAEAFNGKEGSARGDMKTVISTILLDPEARSSEHISMEESNRLREPVVRFTHLGRAVDKDSPDGRFWHNGYSYIGNLKQHPLASPNVFNFFTPDHAPVGPISQAGMVAPEFKLHNTSTAINYMNEMILATNWWSIFRNFEPGIETRVNIDFDGFARLADDPDELINHYDILFTHGQLTDETRDIIRSAMLGINWGDNYKEDRARIGLYLLMVSADYNLMK